MAKMIFILWELCQMVTVTMPFSYAAGDVNRIKLELMDYRMSCKLLYTYIGLLLIIMSIQDNKAMFSCNYCTISRRIFGGGTRNEWFPSQD